MDHRGSTSATAPSAQDPGSGSRNPAEALPNQHTQACRRCREQKLRCSRDLPICKRCERIGAVCIFPDPPDRKLLATQRVRKPRIPKGKRSKSYTGPVDGTEVEAYGASPTVGQLPDFGNSVLGSEDLNVFAGGGQLPKRDYFIPRGPALGAPARELIASDKSLPSPELSMILVEIFFKSVYNATLLFHKDSFLSDYAAERVPRFVLLSIFALASIFSRRPPGDSQYDGSTHQFGISLLSHPELGAHAHAWATTATQQVLMQVDEPCIETIQACQILGLYWFSINQIKKTHMLTHIAYMTSGILGYHVLDSDKDQDHSFDAEKKRRCFWACWITSCISQDNASFKGDSWAAVVELPLPSDEKYFAAGQPEIGEAFDENGRVVSLLPLGAAPRPSYFGELVKLFSLWWEIQSFVRRHLNETSDDSSAVLVNLLLLDRKLELISENLHPHFKYSGPKSFASKSTFIDSHQVLALNALYLLCSCVLHSSIVPLFSGDLPDVEISKKLTRMCAEETVKHSTVSLEMANAYLNVYPDGPHISGLTAYAMFVSSTIQMRSLRVQKKLRTHIGNLRGAVSIISRVKDYWYPTRGMWANLESVFHSTGIDVNHFLAAGDRLQSTPTETRTDIDPIISHNATSEQGTGPDIYTYAPSQVPKGKSSQKSASSHASPGTDVNSNPRSSSISYRPRVKESSSGIGWPPANDGGQLDSDARFTSKAMPEDQQASHPRNPPFIPDQNLSPYQTVSSTTYPSPTVQQPMDALGQGRQMQVQQMIPGRSDMGATNFVEDLNMAYNDSGMNMTNSGGEFWWDQSFEGLDRDPFGLLRGGFPQPMEGMWLDPPA